MASSNFQSGLTAGLALTLGVTLTLALQSSKAVGYPAGSAVSLGANPIESGGGSISTGGTSTIFTPTMEQDFVLTDLILTGRSTDGDCRASLRFDLSLGSGPVKGEFNVSVLNQNEEPRGPQLIGAQYSSGIRIPSGDNLVATVHTNSAYACDSGTGRQVSYSYSGYYTE